MTDQASERPAGTGKRMKLRRDDVCSSCSAAVPAETLAVWDRASRTVSCLACADAVVLPFVDLGGPAGGSARRQYEQRKAKDEERIRERWGRLGGVAVALSDERRSTAAWGSGAIGEERLGARLDSLVPHVAVLHDRKIPGTRANIDHLVVTGRRVWVVDAKRYKGRPTLNVEGGLVRQRTEKLFVGQRNCTKLVDSVLGQVGVVREALADVPVSGALCFVDADWPVVGGSFTTRDVAVLWPRRLAKVLREETGDSAEIAAVRDRLARAFPPACG